MPISNERLSHLIGLIYDAAIDPGRWPEAMEAMRLEINAANCALALQALPSGQILLNLTTNIPDHYLELMPAYTAEVLDIWGGPAVINALPINEPAVISRINPMVTDLTRTTNRYVLEWGKPQGLVDALTVFLARDNRTLGSIAFGRHEAFGLFGEAEIEMVRLLVPHLQRAATINRLLEMSEAVRQSFVSVIDGLATAIVLVDEAMRALHANPAARDLMKESGALRLQGGQLAGTTAGVTSALATAVAQALSDETGLGHKGLGIPAPDLEGNPGALYVLPLHRQSYDLVGVQAAAVFYARQASNFIPPSDLVGELFGLTMAEAKVFAEIVRGSSVPDAAEALGVAQSTVKTHLLRIYSKTGVSRQTDLVKLASSLASPFDA